jgi:hypothetical protein
LELAGENNELQIAFRRGVQKNMKALMMNRNQADTSRKR